MNRTTISSITKADPFESLFPIDTKVLSDITGDMTANGFDEAHPVTIWAEKNVLIDGHTRLMAAGLTSIPVIKKRFISEDAAVDYAINQQRNRRNITQAATTERYAHIAQSTALAAMTNSPKVIEL